MSTALLNLQTLSTRMGKEASAAGEASGKTSLERTKNQREANNEATLAKMQRAKELIDAMEKAKDTDIFDDIGDFFSGRDREEEVQALQMGNKAEMEKLGTQKEVINAERKAAVDDLGVAQNVANESNDQAKELGQAFEKIADLR